MPKLGTMLMVLALAVVAFWLGTRWHPAPTAAAPESAATRLAEQARERAVSASPEAQPVRTFRGPDGRPHMIRYDPSARLDDNDPVQLRAAVLEDMRNHPRNIQDAYDLPLADIDLILAGRKPLPEQFLPEPALPDPVRPQPAPPQPSAPAAPAR
jgi:hypothetical protein